MLDKELIYRCLNEPEKEVTAGRVESGGVVNEVASLEKVTTARSNLNAEKHRAVLVGNTDESHIPRITKGRVLLNSMRGSSVKPGSRFQLRVKGGASTSMAIKKVAERSLSKADASGRLSKLVSDLDKAVVEEETRVTLSQRAAAVDEIRVAWQTNSVFEQPMGVQRIPSFENLVLNIRIGLRRMVSHEVFGFCGNVRSMFRFLHSFFGTFVYASPNSMRQHSLWGHILTLDPGSEHAWVVGGDLNVIGSHLERCGGSKRRFGVCSLFLEFLFDSGLIDMGYNGPQFTWRRGNLFQRLDRCLCSSRWQQVFPWSEVQHLLTLGSDHRPILLNTKRISTHSGARPFRYLSVWNDHPDFHKFLQSVWDGEKHFGENVSAFQSSSKVWNREVFGSLDKRKDILMRRLRGIERALEVHYRPSLVRLEAKLKRELDIVLDQEERFWHQKSRAEWITQGDRNTSYYHMVVSAQRKHNVIRMLRIDGGVWCDEQRLLTNAERVRRHFANSELCGICGGAREDMEHVLRSCAMAKGLWLRLIPSASRVSFFSLTFKEWFCTNLFEGSFVSNDDEWSNRFAIMCWLLWKRRCRLLFEENVGVLDDVLVTGNRLLMQTRDAFTVLAGSYARSAVVRLWSRPPPGWVKMNVDASVSIADQTAGVGGAIRDDTGSWRFGFARFVGRCNALLAELWAIHGGLLHTWELGYLRVELESDFLEAVRIVNCQLSIK
ncbi:hypothetical protein GQ457_10G007230 [Hibiscus cannabinus]